MKISVFQFYGSYDSCLMADMKYGKRERDRQSREREREREETENMKLKVEDRENIVKEVNKEKMKKLEEEKD